MSWSIVEAKAHLSEVLRRARAGEPQIVGAREPCVVISLSEYEKLRGHAQPEHMGRWLIEAAAGLGDIELPSRDDRPAQFPPNDD